MSRSNRREKHKTGKSSLSRSDYNRSPTSTDSGSSRTGAGVGEGSAEPVEGYSKEKLENAPVKKRSRRQHGHSYENTPSTYFKIVAVLIAILAISTTTVVILHLMGSLVVIKPLVIE
ncbi:hypothetical protein V3C99_003037 [Haemonchus contortus]